jgi:hypothetical protein
VPSVAPSVALHDIDDTRTAELCFEFEVVIAPVFAVFYFRAAYRAEYLSLLLKFVKVYKYFFGSKNAQIMQKRYNLLTHLEY